MLHLRYEEGNDRIYTKEYGKNSVSIHISFHEAKVLTLLGGVWTFKVFQALVTT